MHVFLTTFATLLFFMMFGHFVADFPLQGQYLSDMKNRHHPNGANGAWRIGLFAHGMIHAGFVAFVTQSITLGVLEGLVHARIDYLKCEGRISLTTDQVAHVLCKVIWALAIAFMASVESVTWHN